MKRLAILAALAIAATAGAAHAQTPTVYKAGRDFSYLNPGGVWSYGYGQTGTSFTLYSGLIDRCGAAEDGSDCFYFSNALVGSNVLNKRRVEAASASTIVIPEKGLLLHTGSDGSDPIVRFTAPAAGTYRIEGYYQILDNRPTGVAPKIFVDALDVTQKAFRADADVVLTGASDPDAKKVGETRKFALTRKLRKGAVVSFGLDEAGNWTFDSTGFDVTIAPVAE